MHREHRFGLGLRKPHYADFLDREPVAVDFVEVISENFMLEGGRPLDVLRRVRDRHDVALHGVSMSLGSADGLNPDYLRSLRTLVDAVAPVFVSDHLSWSRIANFNSHDLLPLPYTDEALEIVCANLHRAQEALGRTLLIENPSSYLHLPGEMSEWEFLDALCTRTGCELLLDVNNVFVSASNHGFDARRYLAGIPASRVRQIHLAGHSQGRELLIDTHDRPIPPPVWQLLGEALRHVGPVAIMIERDDAIPPLPELLAELAAARDVAHDVARRAA
jgi:uncharacterized protein (UPF0276 family)